MIHHIGPLRPSAGVHYLGFHRNPKGHRKRENSGTQTKGKHDAQDFDDKAKS